MSAHDRQRRRRRRSGGPARFVIFAVGAAAAIAFVAVGAAVAYVISIKDKTPSISQLRIVNNSASSIVFASNGQRLGVIDADVVRTPITSAQIPALLKEATVAIEDQRFYHHGGVDVEGILRAAIKDIVSHQTLQGGSTITMQLVHNLYLPDSGRNLKVKIQEAILAEDLEKQRSKDWILTDYLNSVPYGTVGGQTAVGVQAASRVFFNKPVGALTLPEAALLAGLPQAPTTYNPFLNPDLAMQRRNEVLQKMAQLGYVTKAAAAAAAAQPIRTHRGLTYYTTHREGFFFDYVQQQLVDRYGANVVKQGGLRIYTTLDLGLQQAARNAIANTLYAPGDPASAIVSIDPRNGYIRAMAQSKQYSDIDFNLAAQGHRQPGSTFKTFVLLTALREGIDPDSTYYDSKPLDFVDPQWGLIKVRGEPESGSESITTGFMQSNNDIFMQLDLDVGPKQVAQTAHMAGITSHLDGYPAEGLGGLTLGVSPLEMANAYATVADGGWRNTPIAVLKVVFPGGHTDYLGQPHRVKVFSDGVTAKMTQLLQEYITNGLGTGANYGCQYSGGKTGTTEHNSDAWFVGFTDHLSSAVWIGYPKGAIYMNDVQGTTVQGPGFPATIWHDYMQVATRGDCTPFPQPSQPISYVPFAGRYTSGSGNTGSTPFGATGGAGTYTQPSQSTGTGTGNGGTQTPTKPTAPSPAPSPAPAPTPTPTPTPAPTTGGAAAPHP
jgi:penicillin-binding protein 1A